VAIEVEKLLAEALTKHGIRLDPHDPAVVLVTLNKLVLEDAVKSVVADVRQATSEFEEAAGRVQDRVGAAIAARLKIAAGSAARAPAGWGRWACVYLGLGSGAGLFLIGIAVGRWVLR
jgi:hypothetical protein